MKGGWTEDDGRMNGGWTEDEQTTIEGATNISLFFPQSYEKNMIPTSFFTISFIIYITLRYLAFVLCIIIFFKDSQQKRYIFIKMAIFRLLRTLRSLRKCAALHKRICHYWLSISYIFCHHLRMPAHLRKLRNTRLIARHRFDGKYIINHFNKGTIYTYRQHNARAGKW